ncbi:MAG: hypothetical protein WDN30_13145 [Pararobbsia sp.]
MHQRVRQFEKEDEDLAAQWRERCAALELTLVDRAALAVQIEQDATQLQSLQALLERIDADKTGIDRATAARVAADQALADARHAAQLVEQAQKTCLAQQQEAAERHAQQQLALTARIEALNASVRSAGCVEPADWAQARGWLAERAAEWTAWQADTERCRRLAQQVDGLTRQVETAKQEEAKWQHRWGRARPSAGEPAKRGPSARLRADPRMARAIGGFQRSGAGARVPLRTDPIVARTAGGVPRRRVDVRAHCRTGVLIA